MVSAAAGRGGGGRSWRGWPRWSRPTKRSAAGRPTAARPCSPRSRLGGAPVAGEAAGVGGEQDDVGGDRGRVQVLLVLDGVAAEGAGDDDQGRGAVELGGALLAGGLLQARQGGRADDAEAPGNGEVVVRRPARQLQQLLDLPARQRLRHEGLVGAAAAYRRLDVHPHSFAGCPLDRAPVPRARSAGASRGGGRRGRRQRGARRPGGPGRWRRRGCSSGRRWSTLPTRTGR